MPEPVPDPDESSVDLRALVEAHQVWLRTTGAEGTRLDLSGRRLGGVALAGLDLSEAILVDTDLTGANLRGTDLVRAVLVRADLTEADLSGAHLAKADLSGVRARRARLRRADLLRADLTGADLTDADLSRTQLVRTDLTDADLRGADLTEADLHLVFVGGSTWGRTTATDARGTLAAPEAEVSLDESGRSTTRTVAALVQVLAASGARLVTHPTGGALPEAPTWRWRAG